MKKTLALLLTAFATSAFAQGIADPIPPNSPAIGQRTQTLTPKTASTLFQRRCFIR
ncbi:hypothetical protein [Paraburkholderia xenovorans]